MTINYASWISDVLKELRIHCDANGLKETVKKVEEAKLIFEAENGRAPPMEFYGAQKKDSGDQAGTTGQPLLTLHASNTAILTEGKVRGDKCLNGAQVSENNVIYKIE